MKLRLRRASKSSLAFLGILSIGGILLSCVPQTTTDNPHNKPVLARIADAVGPATASARGQKNLADIAENAMKAVVNVASTQEVHGPDPREMYPFPEDPFFRRYFGGPKGEGGHRPDVKRHALGSGVVVSSDGVILTNNHVIEHADEIVVTLNDGRSFDAEVVGADPKSDLAVLRLKGDDVGTLHPLSFGDSSKLRLADVVLAIGNPFGVGQTVTQGIVSAKGRSNVGIVDYEDFIQTDAAINPGNSGGALLNDRGELVGINTAIVSRSGGYQGVGFAIPSNMAKKIMASLLENGKVVRGWLGVLIQEIDGDLAKALGLDSVTGVLVADVSEDGPAAKAGVKRGDVILAVGSQKVDSTGQLRNLIAGTPAGETVKLAIRRNGKNMTVRVELGELSDAEAEVGGGGRASGDRLGGLSLGALNAESRRSYEIPDDVKDGVVVTAVADNSPAERAGLRRGDVIIEMDRRPIATPKTFATAYKSAGDHVLLLVYRNGRTSFLVMNKDEKKK